MHHSQYSLPMSAEGKQNDEVLDFIVQFPFRFHSISIPVLHCWCHLELRIAQGLHGTNFLRRFPCIFDFCLFDFFDLSRNLKTWSSR